MARPDIIEPGVVSTITGMSASAGLRGGELVHELTIERHVDHEAGHHAERAGGRRGAEPHHRIGEHVAAAGTAPAPG